MANKQSVTQIIGVMAHAYPRFELSTNTMKLYGEMLSNIPVEILEAAARQIMVQSKFFPSIAEWREMAHNLMIGTHNIPSAFEAWQDAIHQVHRCGDYYRYQVITHEPEYSHPLVKKAVEIIGYRNLLESDNTVADRAHFFRIYESLLDRAEDEVRLLPEVKAVSDKYLAGVNILTKRLEAKNE